MADNNENGLPLVSNVNDISVNHYIFNFLCNFEERCFTCYVVLYLEPVIKANEMDSCKCFKYDLKERKEDTDSSSININKENHAEEKMFLLILDCHKIIVDNVEEISLAYSENENFKYVGYNPILFCSAQKLNFVTDKWSLKIWKNRKTCKLCFPKFIRISYKTIPEGPSLLWVTDQDTK